LLSAFRQQLNCFGYVDTLLRSEPRSKVQSSIAEMVQTLTFFSLGKVAEGVSAQHGSEVAAAQSSGIDGLAAVYTLAYTP
jgi:hypothetical protein